jgi:aminopeptidase N
MEGKGREGKAAMVGALPIVTLIEPGHPNTQPPGMGELHITFQGTHNNQMAGFYRSNYKDIEGRSKVMVSTQFESLDARRCFPCWDEPAVKAVFEVRARPGLPCPALPCPALPCPALPCLGPRAVPLTTQLPPAHTPNPQQVTLIIPRGLAAFSNMPELEARELPGSKGQRLVRFAPTPLMSTYLLAFVVGEFDFVQVRFPQTLAWGLACLGWWCPCLA